MCHLTKNDPKWRFLLLSESVSLDAGESRFHQYSKAVHCWKPLLWSYEIGPFFGFFLYYAGCNVQFPTLPPLIPVNAGNCGIYKYNLFVPNSSWETSTLFCPGKIVNFSTLIMSYIPTLGDAPYVTPFDLCYEGGMRFNVYFSPILNGQLSEYR